MSRVWWPLAGAGALTAFGSLMVISATARQGPLALAPEGRSQFMWWGIAVVAAVVAARLPPRWWYGLAVPAYIGGLVTILAMKALAGTALVPRIKGLCNRINLGPIQVQPVEFIKLGTLLLIARLMTSPGFDPRRFGHVALALILAGLPAAMLASSQDLGSALTFVPMAFGVLLVAGLRWRHFALLVLITVALGAVMIHRLPTTGEKSYQYRRIQAWLHPDDYALTEGYQTARSMAAIGSGRLTGKGWAEGDQNRLGVIPEKHTDLISAVIGEELGFAGLCGLFTLYVAFAWTVLTRATQAISPSGRYLGAGYIALVSGQALINLAVATGTMPVTGVTLPFISYGGSSLVGCWLGLGVVLACTSATRSR